MRILIVGAGAVGGYLGARWVEAGRDVTFLVKANRRAKLASSGLKVLRRGPALEIHPLTVTADELDSTFDLVFIAVTGNALPSVLQDIRPAVGPATSIVTSLNGVRHFALLRHAFGDEAVLGSVVKCVTSLDPEGNILELSPSAQISIGTWSGASDDRLAALQKLLQIDSLSVQISSTIGEDINEKWLMMLVLGSANSLLGGDVGAINASREGAWVIQEMLKEGQRALDEVAMPPRQAAVDAFSKMLADRESHQTTSLYRNMVEGHAIEVDAIMGDLMIRVEDHRAYPLLSASYARLLMYERTRVLAEGAENSPGASQR